MPSSSTAATATPANSSSQFGRCVVHFAVDDPEIRMCTELKRQGVVVPSLRQRLERRGRQSAKPEWAQDRLSLEAKSSPQRGLTDILENYAQIIGIKNERTGKIKRVQVFPRYHQLDVVRKTLSHVAANGAGITGAMRMRASSRELKISASGTSDPR